MEAKRNRENSDTFGHHYRLSKSAVNRIYRETIKGALSSVVDTAIIFSILHWLAYGFYCLKYNFHDGFMAFVRLDMGKTAMVYIISGKIVFSGINYISSRRERFGWPPKNQTSNQAK